MVDDEKATLLEFLDAQRGVVLAILDGLDEKLLRATAEPLGWTPLGMVEHLAYAERHWFQEVVLGSAPPLDWPDDDHTPLNTPRPPEVVFAFYAAQRRRADEVIAATPLTAGSVGAHFGDTHDLRWIILHMVEETARHAGHLDVARQLLDGATGLGPR